MKTPLPAVSVLALLSAVMPVRAADSVLDQLATCQVSWLDWKNDPAQAKPFAEALNNGFERKGNDGSWTPRKATTLLGLPVVKVFPESVGMGVGFSVTVDAPFEKARDQVEKASGKKLKDCETGDGMRNCSLEIGEKRTLVVMSGESAKVKQTLIGCYYFYAK